MKFLLDHNISPKVAAAFARLGGKSEILALRDWHGGRYLVQHGQGDKPWLQVAGTEGWVIVHNDPNSLLSDLAVMAAERRRCPGFAVVGKRVADVGWIARQLASLESRIGPKEPPQNVQIWL